MKRIRYTDLRNYCPTGEREDCVEKWMFCGHWNLPLAYGHSESKIHADKAIYFFEIFDAIYI